MTSIVKADRIRKTLTANDLGMTGSHQAGIHVPKSLATFFPELPARALNPDVWISVAASSTRARCRFIHYNNALVAQGTRDEYRLTHVGALLRTSGAATGDSLELTRIGPSSYEFRLVERDSDDEPLLLRTTGRWRVVRLAG